MQTNRQQPVTHKMTAKLHPVVPISAGEVQDRATRLAHSADGLIDRILSGDSREFLDANRQTGGE